MTSLSIAGDAPRRIIGVPTERKGTRNHTETARIAGPGHRTDPAHPWIDSSGGGASDLDDTKPFTVVAYLEMSGFGAKAAALVVKLVFAALGNAPVMEPVLRSDQLDVNSLERAAPTSLHDSSMPAAIDARD